MSQKPTKNLKHLFFICFCIFIIYSYIYVYIISIFVLYIYIHTYTCIVHTPTRTHTQTHTHKHTHTCNHDMPPNDSSTLRESTTHHPNPKISQLRLPNLYPQTPTSECCYPQHDAIDLKPPRPSKLAQESGAAKDPMLSQAFGLHGFSPPQPRWALRRLAREEA